MTNEIKCPQCGAVLKIDESSYESIVNQIRNHEFLEELSRKEKDLEDRQKTELELARTKAEADYKEELRKKDEEYNRLQASFNEKDIQIATLEQKLSQAEEVKKSAVSEALSKEKEANQANIIKINNLENELKNKDTEKELALKDIVSEKDKEIAKLTNDIANNERVFLEKETSLKANFDSQIKMKDEEIERYRDFKAKQSTKMIGESLEQHCEIEFNKNLRPILPKAYFEKDNTPSKESGSKGDFIYRDYDEDGNEFISIMFEMKNEADTTEKKHKNEDFLKELDKDRNEKGCEYAVLVSMLESDNDLYNGGIVDMSHKYEKMYVVRPQFFIPIITLLRNSALKTVSYKQQLIAVQNQNLDITTFEDNMNKFKESFAVNYDRASKHYGTAIKEIDNTIKKLEKIRDALESVDNNLRIANDKAQDITIKKLTKNAPSVQKMFDELKEE